ncbi:hypothetical protein LTR64_006304 [Lithohypha guttulata]|uniref:uncharacterized protein n=1 Tax=Lithohypha guttulata TaxID=1690604 RepID=UPI002DDF43D8|nr:hypothetical protein LTR51_001898 [Lithohypha guttulata]
MAEIQGFYDPKFHELSSLLKSFVISGEEVGASICVNLDAKDVVDIWAGYTDEARTHPWQKDTITNVWSTTKTVISLAAFILTERGLLDLEQNVAYYWPEFAANGKENVKVKHILSHTSGVSGWDEKISWEDICDFEKAVDLLAKQRPWWEPGTASGYHSLTMGHLVSEVVRRISGKPFKQFVEEEIAGPLQADFQIGAKESDWSRISNVIPPPPLPRAGNVSRESIMFKTFTNPPLEATVAHTPRWRQADLGACNGHANARSIARMLSPISLGGNVTGLEKPLLSPKTIDLIFNQQAYGEDLVIGLPIRFGTGFGLPAKGTVLDWLPSGRICFWTGWGGSIVIIDCDRRLTIAYAMNKMDAVSLGGTRTRSYIEAVYRALNVSLPKRLPLAKI